MQYPEFKQKIIEILPAGTVLNNPLRGTSTIKEHNGTHLRYVRGNSTISINLEALYETYLHFNGRQVNSNELKIFKPKIFDSSSSGHDCNRSTFFLVMREIGLTDRIQGKGVRGNPFYINLR